MNAMKTIRAITIAIYFLFYPVFWTVKAIKKFSFETRKAKAIREAELLHSEKGKHIYVVQNGQRFVWGTREKLRELNTKKKKKVKGTGLIFDYRKAIIYTAK